MAIYRSLRMKTQYFLILGGTTLPDGILPRVLKQCANLVSSFLQLSASVRYLTLSYFVTERRCWRY